jgi:saccharopine dehydrogenase-like NADP-dependent oxidoreductase
MSKNIVILGGGMVGETIAIELSKQYDVTVIDIDNKILSKLKRCFNINCIQTDVTNRKILQQNIVNADLVIGALPGSISFSVLKNVIEAGKNIIDISFMPENALELNKRAKCKNVTAVIDCGIAPGISNMIIGYHNLNMKVEQYECLVGGLPFERIWPWEYKAMFSPADVIEEYVRPARYIKNGKQIVKQAFSDPELINFPNIGTLEAWNSDGLRTLLKTVNVPNMVEKTLRYPGTIEYLKVLRESGFFSYHPIEINGVEIRPIDLTTKLLAPEWELKKTDKDFTIMQCKVLGYEKDEPSGYEYFIYDEYDSQTGLHSMARTTGFSCAAVADILLNKIYTDKGIIPPETIAAKGDLFTQIINYLEKRGITIDVNKMY